MNVKKEAALSYHSKFPAGKIEVNATKEVSTQRDLSLAYSPGVAEPCMEIFHDPDKVYDYTIKGNLVAVITNGTAVLGLGNIGPEASKPVMEGKAVLFNSELPHYAVNSGTNNRVILYIDLALPESAEFPT